MAPRFVFCPACNRPAHPRERACPFCDAALSPDPALPIGVGVALSVGLSLAAGCDRAPVAPEAPRAAGPDASAIPMGHAPPAAPDTSPTADAGEGTIGMGSIGTIGVYGGPPAPRVVGSGAGSGYGVYGAPPSALREGAAVRAALPTVQGALSLLAVRRVVMRNLGQVQRCVEAGVAARPELAGRVVVRFVIDAAGMVIGSGVESSTLPTPSVAECIAAAPRRWQFPAPEGGVVMVHQPYNVPARAP